MKRTKKCIYESGQKTPKSKQPYKQGFSNSSFKLEKHPRIKGKYVKLFCPCVLNSCKHHSIRRGSLSCYQKIAGGRNGGMKSFFFPPQSLVSITRNKEAPGFFFPQKEQCDYTKISF